jgi:hypothetical protein
VRRGDVTKLGEMRLDGPFDLVLDLGCFHFSPVRGARCVRGRRRLAHRSPPLAATGSPSSPRTSPRTGTGPLRECR